MKHIEIFEYSIGRLYYLRAMNQMIHWNYVGNNFIEFHKYLDEVLEQYDSFIDELAEDLRKNDMFVQNPLQLVMQQQTFLKFEKTADEMDIVLLEYYDTIKNFIITNNKYLEDIRENDLFESSKDILVRLNQELGKVKWFLQSSFKIIE